MLRVVSLASSLWSLWKQRLKSCRTLQDVLKNGLEDFDYKYYTYVSVLSILGSRLTPFSLFLVCNDIQHTHVTVITRRTPTSPIILRTLMVMFLTFRVHSDPAELLYFVASGRFRCLESRWDLSRQGARCSCHLYRI
jgi:hypothetical protein